MNRLFILIASLCVSISALPSVTHTEIFKSSDLKISTVKTENGINPTQPAVRSAEVYRPLVHEGRTWWYSAQGTQRPTQEFGITIGDEVEYNGKLWHEVKLIASADYLPTEATDPISFSPGTPDNWANYKNEDVLLAYIREEDKRVYSCFPSNQATGGDVFTEMGYWFYFAPYPAEILIYDFNIGQDDNLTIGNEVHKATFKVDATGTINSCGYTYPSISAKFVNSDNFLDNARFDYEFAQCIGATKRCLTGPVFFCPPVQNPVMSMFSYKNIDLRYVTDGDNNDIIYEGCGGKHLWDGLNAVTTISTGNADMNISWYTLQGVRVENPDIPGVYVKVVGTTATKVVIK